MPNATSPTESATINGARRALPLPSGARSPRSSAFSGCTSSQRDEHHAGKPVYQTRAQPSRSGRGVPRIAPARGLAPLRSSSRRNALVTPRYTAKPRADTARRPRVRSTTDRRAGRTRPRRRTSKAADDPPFAATDPADQARTPKSAASARLIGDPQRARPPWTVRCPQIASPSCHKTSATSPSVTNHSSTRPGESTRRSPPERPLCRALHARRTGPARSPPRGPGERRRTP